MKFLKYFFSPTVKYLPEDFCEGKNDQELVHELKHENISSSSGQIIVTELLSRLVEKTSNKKN